MLERFAFGRDTPTRHDARRDDHQQCTEYLTGETTVCMAGRRQNLSVFLRRVCEKPAETLATFRWRSARLNARRDARQQRSSLSGARPTHSPLKWVRPIWKLASVRNRTRAEVIRLHAERFLQDPGDHRRDVPASVGLDRANTTSRTLAHIDRAAECRGRRLKRKERSFAN